MAYIGSLLSEITVSQFLEPVLFQRVEFWKFCLPKKFLQFFEPSALRSFAAVAGVSAMSCTCILRCAVCILCVCAWWCVSALRCATGSPRGCAVWQQSRAEQSRAEKWAESRAEQGSRRHTDRQTGALTHISFS
jgi:hypothetical protein